VGVHVHVLAHTQDGAPQHTDRIAAHARAMRAVDPAAEIYFNSNELEPASLTTVLGEMGEVIDGAEFHGKWPYGGTPSLPAGTFGEWLNEVPLVERKSNETWRDKLSKLRAAAVAAGYPQLKLANNEFGLGKSDRLVGFNRYTKSLVAVEFAMEMFIAGYDVAAFWDNGDGGKARNEEQMLLSTATGYRFNPMHFGLEMLAVAANTTYLPLNTSERRVHGFASLALSARSDKSDVLRIYLLNKLETPASVSISLHAGVPLPRMAQAMVDTADHWGALRDLQVKCAYGSPWLATPMMCEVQLPPLSFAMVRTADSE